jgi:hypothetical protein
MKWWHLRHLQLSAGEMKWNELTAALSRYEGKRGYKLHIKMEPARFADANRDLREAIFCWVEGAEEGGYGRSCNWP